MSVDSMARKRAAKAKKLAVANTDLITNNGTITLPSTNVEAYIEAACAAVGTGGLVKLKKGSRLYLTRSVLIPSGVSIDFNGTKISPANGANISNFYNGFAFLLNTDASGNMISGYGGDMASLDNWYFLNEPWQGVTPLVGWRGFYSKSRHSLKGKNKSEGMYQTYYKPIGYGTEYIDQIEIRNINIGDHMSTDWCIDFGGLGDSIEIDNIGMWLSQTNRNLVRLINNRGGRISRILGAGNVLISSCDSVVVDESHIEQGYIEADDSTVTIRNCHIWKNPTYQPIAPIVFKNVTWQNASGPNEISNVNIFSTFKGTGDWRPSAFGNETSDAAIDDGIWVKISNFFRSFGGSSSTSRSPALIGTSSTPSTNWTNRRHMLMLGATVHGGSAIHTSHIPRQTVNNSISLNTGSNSISNDTPWRMPSGTYYYRIQALYGQIANLIGQRFSEFSVALTQAETGAMWFTGLSLGYTPVFLRIFRGTTAGTYTHYVDTAIMSGFPIDTGYYLATGEAWQPIGSVTATYTNGNFNSVGFSSDDPGAKTIAYGAFTSATPVPNGNWTAGDRMIAQPPVIGQPKAMTCTTSGFNTTAVWTSEGNL